MKKVSIKKIQWEETKDEKKPEDIFYSGGVKKVWTTKREFAEDLDEDGFEYENYNPKYRSFSVAYIGVRNNFISASVDMGIKESSDPELNFYEDGFDSVEDAKDWCVETYEKVINSFLLVKEQEVPS